MPTIEDVSRLVDYVERGDYVAALRDFYSAQATMQENQDEPRRGLETLIAGEEIVLRSYQSITTRRGTRFAVNGDTAMIHWIFDIAVSSGMKFTLDEIAMQRWEGDKVVEERFYYDPAQRLRPAAT